MPNRGERIKPGDNRQIEFRNAPMQTRADGEPGFDGYASTNWVVDSYGTAFAPGAWKKTISERGDRILVLWQHDPYSPIGKPTRLEEDDRGLAITARISEGTHYGSETMALLRDDIPLGLSVGFRTIRERQANDSDPLILSEDMPEWVRANLPDSVWVIEEAKLYEFSPVSFAANSSASVTTVREERAQLISQLLEDLRAGTLDAAGRALVAELVAAWPAAPDGSDPAPRTESTAPRRRRDAELALARFGHLLKVA